MLFNSPFLYTQVIINEVQSQNTSTIFDEDGETPDWIELYNYTDSTVNLNGYSISDDQSNPQKWIFPDLNIKPKDYLLLFASGKDRKEGIIGLANSSSGFGHWKSSDDFTYNYQEIDGNFDMSAQISYFEFMNEFSEAGIMVRENLTDKSKYTGCFITNKSKLFIHINPSENPEIEQQWFKMWDIDYYFNFPNIWIRIKRVNDSISFYYSETGNSWHYHSSVITNIGRKCYIGIASSSGNTIDFSEIYIKNLKINNYALEFKNLSKIEIGKYSRSKPIISQLHTFFNLDKDNDSIFLSNGQVNIDTLYIPKLKNNISYGKQNNLLKYFEKPTPKESNIFGKDSSCLNPVISYKNFGLTSDKIEVTFSSIDKIYYTIDCSKPDSNSIQWDGKPLVLKKPSIIRAIAYSESKISSNTVTKSFINNDNPEIAIVSISTNPENLFSDSVGLLNSNPNLLRNIEYECNVEYQDINESIYAINCGLSLQGNLSKTLDQKALKLTARNSYEENRFNFSFFDEYPNLKQTKRLSLRNCSMDWSQTMIRDAFANKLCQLLKLDDYELVKPIIVFLNSKYWGLYNFQTRINSSYLSDKYSILENDINVLIYNSFPDKGDNISYINFVDSLYNTKNCTDEFLLKNIDLNSFTEYFFIQFYSANYDWPHRNSKIWNSPSKSLKWKWIPYDFDESFLHYHINSSLFERIEDSSLGIDKYNVFYPIYKKVLESNTLRNSIFSRFQDLLNYTFQHEKILPIFNQLVLERNSEITKQKQRWPNSLINYEENLDGIRLFIEKRPLVLLNQVVDLFYKEGLSKFKLITNITNAGTFNFNSLSFVDSISGLFIKELPLTITAKPNKGYKFIGWNCDTTHNSTITIYPTEDMEIIAYFEKNDNEENPQIVINEIMYKSPDSKDTKDWIELYNNSDFQIDLSGWIFKDSDDSHKYVIDSGTIISPDDYLVLINDKSEFTSNYPFISNFQGSFDFGLGRGDLLRIFNDKDELIDFVKYESSAPWPADADGKGASLELIHPNLDNNLVASWIASAKELGTPGEKNSRYDSVLLPKSVENDFYVFPNPFCEYVFITKTNPDINISKVELYDLIGNLISIQDGLNNTINSNSIYLELSNFVKGIYFIQITYMINNKVFIKSKKIIKN